MSTRQVEPELVAVARSYSVGRVGLHEVIVAFGRALVYARTPKEAPRLYVADLAKRGRWAAVFTSTDRLAISDGECDYLGMTGAEFVEFIPSGVGLVIDPDDEHAVALPPQVIERSAGVLGVRRSV